MSIYLVGVFWVIGAVIVGAVIGYLVRRFGWDEGRPDNNDAAGQVFTIIGGLQAVLVAFVLISLFDSVSTVRDGSYQEADSLVAASWAADSLPDATRDQFHDLSKAYARTVIEQEWPRMRDDRAVPDTGWTQLNQMRLVVGQAVTNDDWQKDRKTEASNQLWQVYQARQARLTSADGNGVSGVVWFALIIGSFISVLLPNLFGGTRLGAHIIIVSTVAGAIALLLFAIYQLQNPFSGGAKIGPEAFSSALERLT